MKRSVQLKRVAVMDLVCVRLYMIHAQSASVMWSLNVEYHFFKIIWM